MEVIPVDEEFKTGQNGELTVYTGMGGDVIIPGRFRVVGDGSYWIWGPEIRRPPGMKPVTSLAAEDGVQTIQDLAFSHCPSLASFSLPDSVEVLGNSVFLKCSSLREAVLPDSVKDMGEGVFRECTSLERAVLPAHLTVLPASTFCMCENLKEVVLPCGLREIGFGAFLFCKSLARIILPPSITAIHSGAFEGCTGLREILIPDTVQEIGRGAFEGCISLKKVSLPSTLDMLNSELFKDCSGLVQCVLPDRVRWMEAGVFCGCRSLTSVSIPEGAERLSPEDFKDCEKLKKVFLSSTVTCVSASAFIGCTSLREFAVSPENATYTGTGPFLCTNGGTVLYAVSAAYTAKDSIPPSITTISDGAFYLCPKLQRLSLPETVTALEPGAFLGLNKLKLLEAPGVTDCVPGTIMGKQRSGKEAGRVFPMILPKILLSRASTLPVRQSLAMGYLMKPELYQKRAAAGYEKFIDENLDLLKETARREKLTDIIKLLSERSPDTDSSGNPDTDSDGIPLFLSHIRAADARQMYAFAQVSRGIIITSAGWHENKPVVIPDVIGRTPVVGVAPDSCPENAVIRCSSKLFSSLPVNYQFNSFIACRDGSVEFSRDQKAAMAKQFSNPQHAEKLLTYAMENGFLDIFTSILSGTKLKIELYDSLLEKTSKLGLAEYSAALLNAKGSYYTEEQVQEHSQRVLEEEVGLREISLATLRKTFRCKKKYGKIMICGFSHAQETCFIPASAGGLPVAVESCAFWLSHTLKSAVFESGSTEIGDYAFDRYKMTVTAPPGSSVEEYCKKEGVKFIPSGSPPDT